MGVKVGADLYFWATDCSTTSDGLCTLAPAFCVPLLAIFLAVCLTSGDPGYCCCHIAPVSSDPWGLRRGVSDLHGGLFRLTDV